MQVASYLKISRPKNKYYNMKLFLISILFKSATGRTAEPTIWREGQYAQPYFEETSRALMGTAASCPAGSFDVSEAAEEAVSGNTFSQGSRCK